MVKVYSYRLRTERCGLLGVVCTISSQTLNILMIERSFFSAAANLAELPWYLIINSSSTLR